MRKGIILCLFSAGILLFGTGAVVRVSEFQPDSKNATAAIQAALDSGAAKVIVDKVDFDYLVETIDFRSNQEVVLEDGVVIAAIPGGHKFGGACLARMAHIHNTILRGEGTAILRMNKKDYQNPKLYSPSEHRHLLPIVGCNNVTVKDITIESSGGDGIYITGDAKQWWSSNILLENVISRDHHRQGCSVISAENLLIRNCQFLDTAGTPPAAGIDLEPNNTDQKLTNCLIENCYFKGNVGGAFGAGLHQTLCEPISIIFRDCVAEDNPGGSVGAYASGSPDKKLAGTFDVINCKFRQPKGMALGFQNFRSGGLLLRFRDCSIDMSGNPSSLGAFGTVFRDDVGEFDFGNLEVKRPRNAAPLFAIGALGAPKFCTPAGSITVEYEDGVKEEQNLTVWTKLHPGNPDLLSFESRVCNTQQMFPVAAEGNPQNTVKMRGPQRFLQFGELGKPIELTFEVTWIRDLPRIEIPVTITDSDGNKEGEFTIAEPKTVYSFTPSHTQVFVFSFRCPLNMTIYSSAPGQGYDCSNRLTLMGCEQDFYFPVQEGLESILLELSADAGENAQASLYDENGNLVAETDYNFGIQLLQAKRKEGERNAAVWRVHVKGDEDHAIRLGTPLEPILYTDPKNILMRK